MESCPHGAAGVVAIEPRDPQTAQFGIPAILVEPASEDCMLPECIPAGCIPWEWPPQESAWAASVQAA
jgi:hypothetical protein